MKIQLFLLFLFVCSLMGCKHSDPGPSSLELSVASFGGISSGDTILEVNITCPGKWTVQSNALWCLPDVVKGSGDYVLKLAIGTNIEEKQRTGRLTVTSGGTSRFVEVTQEASDMNVEDYYYRIPVVFHVLYKDDLDSLQYVDRGRLAKILENVNRLYQRKVEGMDMKLEFVLPEADPNGKPMEEPGVERVKWGTASMDCDEFMSNERNKYTSLLWDPNQYINVMVYNFTSDGGRTVTLGISHLPYSVKGIHQLAGLNVSNYSIIKLSQLKYAHCVSINSLFIYDESDDTVYSTTDVNVTLAHELGHYLGLHHVFAEAAKGGVLDDCVDSDYCDDTPSYNKIQYDLDYEYYSKHEPEKFTFENLVKRNNCSGEPFVSTNVMDYAVSYSNRFTDDQRGRIRHVLNYSPLIPGPKAGLTTRASSEEEQLDLPLRVVK